MSHDALAHQKVHIFGTNAAGGIYYRHGATVSHHGQQWQQLEGSLKQIHVEAGGLVWGVNSSDDIYRRTGVSHQNPIGSGWEKVEGKLKHVCLAAQPGAAPGNFTVWGVNSQNNIYMKSGVTAHSAGGPWQQVEGQLKQIHVDYAGAVIGVNANDDIYRRTGVSPQHPAGTGWQQFEGKLKHISIAPQLGADLGTSVIWGVNAQNNIYIKTGVTAQSTGKPWQQVDGQLKCIHVDAVGVVYGTNAADDIYRRTGITAHCPQGSGWQQVEGKLVNLAIAVDLSAR